MRLMSKALVATTIFSIFGIALAGSATTEKTLQEIASYRQWTKITPIPLAVEPQFASPGG